MSYAIPGQFLSIYTVLCLNHGISEIINFPFLKTGKLIILSVPKLKHVIGRLNIK